MVASREEQVKQEIESVMSGLPPASQRRVAKRLMRQEKQKLKNINLEKADVEAKLALKQVELDSLRELQSFFEAMPSWDDVVLEKNTCSRLHKLKDAFVDGRVINTEDREAVSPCSLSDELNNTFVVKHDWRSVLDGVNPTDDEVRIPYDVCAFEFRISGMTVIAWAWYDERIHFTCFIESGGYWCSMPDDTGDCEIGRFVWAQIKAICVALDAEIACHEVVRAPHKLNAKRERSGKTPLANFHVVDLSKRYRVSNIHSGESGHKVRLHFRRGHWRHYEDFKTWVKWCLVGDPDLGFVSKHYKI